MIRQTAHCDVYDERCPYTAGCNGSQETQSNSDGGRDEMVSGVEETTVSTDSSSDETRGAKVWLTSW